MVLKIEKPANKNFSDEVHTYINEFLLRNIRASKPLIPFHPVKDCFDLTQWSHSWGNSKFWVVDLLIVCLDWRNLTLTIKL